MLRRLHHAPVLLLCIAVLGWSGNFVVGRLVGGTVPPVGLAFTRWVLAFLVLLPFGHRLLRRDLPVLRRHARLVGVLAVTGITVFNTFVYIGLTTTTAVNGLLLQSVGPLLIVALAALFFRDHPTRAQLLGLAVSLIGVWIVVSRGDVLRGRFAVGTGELWILAAVVSYAVYTCLLRARPPVHPVSLLLATFGIGALGLAPFAIAEWLGGHRMPATGGALAAVLYVALVPSIVSYFCWNRGVELLGPGRAGQFIHLMPVFGAVLAFVVLGEALQPFHLVGAAIIGAGILLASRQRRPGAEATGRPAPP